MQHSPIKLWTILLAVLMPTFSHAGAWTKAQGDGEAVLTALYFTSNGFWDRNGNRSSQQRFNKYELNPYGEYGLTDEITVGANLFLHQTTQRQSGAGGGTASNIGLGNSEFFARREIWRDDYSVLSIQPLISLPSLYNDDAVPRSGSDSFDTELSLLGGHSFNVHGRAHYAEARIGYRHRFDNELEDQLRIDAKLGYRLNERWELIPAIYSIWAVNADKRAFFTEDGQQDFDLVKVEAVARYNLSSQLYLQAGASAHVYGRNVGDGYALMFATGLVF